MQHILCNLRHPPTLPLLFASSCNQASPSISAPPSSSSSTLRVILSIYVKSSLTCFPHLDLGHNVWCLASSFMFKTEYNTCTNLTYPEKQLATKWNKFTAYLMYSYAEQSWATYTFIWPTQKNIYTTNKMSRIKDHRRFFYQNRFLRLQKTTQNHKADNDAEVGADVVRLRFLERKIMMVQGKGTRVYDTWPLQQMNFKTDIPQ